MAIPTLHRERLGFGVMCGGCLKSSECVTVDSPEDAWKVLQALGWSMFNAYALCPACTKDPPDAQKSAARAMKARKRR
jgi:hypothetical protein